ncbi:hypothetical protein KY290_024230 [Solanum tuberosum]|uniref:Uncharacterized protein n=1 Tax=Solanum tuberosum TaxID=4113 RepID=A0ABQ7UQ48_SOLTU|nr:hypothetical protein KY290_024230 [Solanum tuberosum]
MVNNVPTAASEPRGEFNQANLKDAAPEAKGSDVSGLQHDLAPMRGFPDASMVEIMASDSSNGQKLGSDQPENPLPPADSSHQRIQPNPCRSVGDALEGWKTESKSPLISRRVKLQMIWLLKMQMNILILLNLKREQLKHLGQQQLIK